MAGNLRDDGGVQVLLVRQPRQRCVPAGVKNESLVTWADALPSVPPAVIKDVMRVRLADDTLEALHSRRCVRVKGHMAAFLGLGDLRWQIDKLAVSADLSAKPLRCVAVNGEDLALTHTGVAANDDQVGHPVVAGLAEVRDKATVFVVAKLAWTPTLFLVVLRKRRLVVDDAGFQGVTEDAGQCRHMPVDGRCQYLSLPGGRGSPTACLM